MDFSLRFDRGRIAELAARYSYPNEGKPTAPVAAMIKLQRMAGMRPGSVVIMRGGDITRLGGAWEYRPATHKTEQDDLDLVVRCWNRTSRRTPTRTSFRRA